MQEINRTYEQSLSVNAGGIYQIFSLDLSVYSERHVMVSVDTTAYDPLNGDTSIRHSVIGLYNNTASTVVAMPNYQDEQYDFNQGDSDIQQISYNQGTGILTQSLNVVTTGSRAVKVISFVKILLF